MRLEEDQIRALPGFMTAEEMLIAHLEQIRRRCITGDMAAQLAVCAIGTHDHGQGIPAQDRREPLLDGQIAWVSGLVLDRYGIQVGRDLCRTPRQAPFASVRQQRIENLAGPRTPMCIAPRGQDAV